ncbi:collagenase [Microbulbifer mangrovi]|uniref:collagenase n=1 Tax=Microbulbifer mangrovi TaxID=927787 RepID=UPI0013019338|nr:collagenase [Microbulbifer mangrovi]
MTRLRQHPVFSADSDKAARLQEHFAVTLFRYYDRAPLAARLPAHVDTLQAVLERYQRGDLSVSKQYALWESLRAIGFLGYQARSNQLIADTLLHHKRLEKTLLEFSRSDNGYTEERHWPLNHTLWALGNLQLLMDEEQGELLDETVWRLLSRDLSGLNQGQQQALYTRPYLVTSFRGKSACEEEFPERCALPDASVALPISHNCSESLIIRANSMGDAALLSACEQMLAQEQDFHLKLASDGQPVAEDHNDKLEVVVFDNYSQYNQYASLLFDINTNNGGMYLEGTPEEPGNQARFIAFEAFWKDPDFTIWNLEHEYVHYLDGRFNKRGGFGHFPSHMVWWSEGLANYIAQGEEYDSAQRDLNESRPSDYPSLADIFATTYEDGSTRVYSWSYLAIQFLYQQDRSHLSRLADHLRADDFEGYTAQLDKLADTLQPAFADWLRQRASANDSVDEPEKLPRRLYRYLYRDYLQPLELSAGEQHRHLG